MPYPKSVLMSAHIGSEVADSDWQRDPASLAEKLSGGRWRRYRHLDFLSNKIRVLEDHPIFLIITMPPRHGKSELISHWTPIWFLKRWPYKHIILASYQAGFAAEWGGVVRNAIIEHEARLEIQLAGDTRSKSEWRIKGYGGGMLASGVMGPITGHGGDLLIIDDPIKSQKEALSLVYRESIKQWYRSTFRTRAQPNASIILLMTRWHEDDLAGYLVSESQKPESDLPRDPWEVINLPALAEPGDPLGRPEGEALWPEMYPRQSLLQVREAIGPYWYSAEYQGYPRPEGGSIIKEAWFQYYSDQENPLVNESIKVERCIQIWDTAFELDDASSRSACMTWVKAGQFFYVIDVWAKRVEFPDLIQAAKMKYAQWKPTHIYIEHKASGHSLVQQLRRDTSLPIIPVKAEQDKASRLNAVSGIVEAGRVKLPAQAPWLSDFLYEICSFPAAKTDDIADCFAHGLMQMHPSLGRGDLPVRRGVKESIWKRTE